MRSTFSSATIALDATYGVVHPRHPLTGVGVYSRRMLQGLAAAHPQARFRWCYRAHRFQLGLQESKPANAVARPLLDRFVPPCDLFHGLNQRLPIPRTLLGKKIPTVCTFHDLFVMTSDAYSSADFRARFAQLALDAAGRADVIIAVSAFTAGQVAHLLSVAPSRIRVVHHGVEMPLTPPAETQRDPMILTVGAMQRRKNTQRLVEAFEGLDAPEWRLVIAGPAGFGSEEIMQRIERSSKRELIDLPGFIPDAERQRLYGRASIFAFPSLDEGFGIPLLEAMAHGAPVVASNSSSMPEVAGPDGEAALLVAPTDVAALGAALQRLVDDAGLRIRLAEAGLRRARGFSWNAAVERTWAVYQELLG